MSLVYTEYDGVTTHTMETEAGTVGGTKRNVHGLAPAIVAQYADMVTALDTIATNTTGIGGTPVCKVFQNTDIDAADEALGASEACVRVVIKNISTANQRVYVIYASQGTATTTNGYELAPGEEHEFPGVTNVTDLHVIASAVNASVCYRTSTV